jgi:thymidylate synthase
MKPTLIIARDLDEAWFEVLRATLDDELAYDYAIQRGSFEGGGTRRQLYSLTLCVQYPETRPLGPMVPEGFSPPTNNDKIERYFAEQLMNPVPALNEDYNYAQFIVPHLPRVIALLTETPYTNHAVVNVGEAFSHEDGVPEPKVYEFPPCLRCLHWLYRDEAVHLYTFWRSWDLYAGLPENLGGLQLLNEYVAMEVGCRTGTLNAFSSGAHIYGYHRDLVDARMGGGSA